MRVCDTRTIYTVHTKYSYFERSFILPVIVTPREPLGVAEATNYSICRSAAKPAILSAVPTRPHVWVPISVPVALRGSLGSGNREPSRLCYVVAVWERKSECDNGCVSCKLAFAFVRRQLPLRLGGSIPTAPAVRATVRVILAHETRIRNQLVISYSENSGKVRVSNWDIVIEYFLIAYA